MSASVMSCSTVIRERGFWDMRFVKARKMASRVFLCLLSMVITVHFLKFVPYGMVDPYRMLRRGFCLHIILLNKLFGNESIVHDLKA